MTGTATSPATLLHLLWLASPALPVGAFSYSEGLEAAIEEGAVHDEASARAWLVNQLALVMARSELPLVAAAHAAASSTLPLDAAKLQSLNDWVRQTREAAEPLLQTQQMGKSLLVWIETLQGEGETPCPTLPLLRALRPAPTWPVVLGCAAAWRGASVAESLHAAAFGWAENMVQAAVRAVPLGQSAGQRLLARLVAAIPAAVAEALAAPEPIAFAPRLAIASARHEAQYSRLFRS
ncbi:MAG: urease accessory protein UreF [Burkholderiales bacterium]|nr:urease accessory protein UreF [Burkholderiales bacterium]